jgi:hypothetical protein
MPLSRPLRRRACGCEQSKARSSLIVLPAPIGTIRPAATGVEKRWGVRTARDQELSCARQPSGHPSPPISGAPMMQMQGGRHSITRRGGVRDVFVVLRSSKRSGVFSLGKMLPYSMSRAFKSTITTPELKVFGMHRNAYDA